MKPKYITTDLTLITSIDITQYFKLKHLGGNCYKFKDLSIDNFKGDDNLFYVNISKHGDQWSTIKEHFPILIKFLTKLFGNKSVTKKKFQKIDFDMGFDAGDEMPCNGFSIPNAFLSKIAALSATITITIYPYDKSNEIILDEKPPKKVKKVVKNKIK